MADSCIFESPIGLIKICEENDRITGLHICNEVEKQAEMEIELPKGQVRHSDLLYEAYKQVTEYFAGRRMKFDLPLSYRGTPFQQKVWMELQKIPYGETWSYEDIAAGIGNKKAVRAVGQANHRNPIMIIIPCHRVINKNGNLAGFGGGLEAKRYLLELEKGRM